MKSTIIYKDKYIIQNTFVFKDKLLFKQDIAEFEEKEKAIDFRNKYCKIFDFVKIGGIQ